MTRTGIRLLTIAILTAILNSSSFLPADSGARSGDPKEAAIDLFLSHLRGHFDDIHDVSMRYHLHDPSLGGVIALTMEWEDGRLVKATVEENETGCQAEAASLIEAIKNWHIEGLDDASFTIPFRISMVGSDDPDFHQRAILTGTVRSSSGEPLAGAEITLVPADPRAAAVPPAVTNREGIYIKSLIPSGTWSVRCAVAGHRAQKRENVTLRTGGHRILDFVLEAE